jgi:hypothetical protein
MSSSEHINEILADYRETNGHEWPNCDTPDCEHKRCCWAGTGRCYPCSRRVLGKAEMDRRYNATHDAEQRWTGAVAEEPNGR